MIELNNITVSKYGNNLFDDFSLTLASDEHWVFQGRNGSGKTTLLEIISGQLHPKSGTVNYDFIDRTADWDNRYQQRKERIHYIPAHALHQVLGELPGLFYQQRYYSLGDVQLPCVKDFFGSDLSNLESLKLPESFDVHNLLHLELTRLSNGQLKKIIIVKQLLKNVPTVLLLDYPFEGLDRESRIALSDFIDHLATTFKIQIILTDHYHELPSVINKKLVLRDFEIERTETVYTGTVKNNTNQTTAFSHNTIGKTPVVEMKALTIQYGDKKIIHNLNWKINKGDRWALTGKNGSGKTTLFSLIYADHPMAYSQPVYLFGKRRGTGESIWDIKKRINYLGPEQIHFLDPASTAFSARQYITSLKNNSEERLERMIDFFAAGKFIHKPVKHLSSGELQMMMLILFFLSDKELLLLDEPFQFLDPVQKDNVNNYLNAYLNESTTLVLITHYEADIEKWTQLRMRL